MIKATNPHTRQTVIVTAQEADKMRRSIACREYQFEVIEQQEAAEPPIVEPPERFEAVPPEVNLPETTDHPGFFGTPDGAYETPLDYKKVTKRPAKQGQ
mgnify:CR=1 FL=1